MEQYGNALIGKIVESVEISEAEVLLTFTDGSEIAVSLSAYGGDYGAPFIATSITEPD